MSFPTTPVLDAFPYSVGDLAPFHPPWVVPGGGFFTLRVGDVVANTINTVGGTQGCYWNKTAFAEAQECYADVVHIPAAPDDQQWVRMMARIQNPLSGTVKSSYDVRVDGTGVWSVTVTVNNTPTINALGVTQLLAVGDKVGIAVAGDLITAWWYNGSASRWQVIGTWTDNQVVGVGYIGVAIRTLSGTGEYALDNFGGGSGSEVLGPVNRLGWP